MFDLNEKFVFIYWGNSEIVWVEYNCEEIFEKVILECKVLEVYLYCDKVVYYRGSFKVNWSYRLYFEFEFYKLIFKSLWFVFFELFD